VPPLHLLPLATSRCLPACTAWISSLFLQGQSCRTIHTAAPEVSSGCWAMSMEETSSRKDIRHLQVPFKIAQGGVLILQDVQVSNSAPRGNGVFGTAKRGRRTRWTALVLSFAAVHHAQALRRRRRAWGHLWRQHHTRPRLGFGREAIASGPEVRVRRPWPARIRIAFCPMGACQAWSFPGGTLCGFRGPDSRQA